MENQASVLTDQPRNVGLTELFWAMRYTFLWLQNKLFVVLNYLVDSFRSICSQTECCLIMLGEVFPAVVVLITTPTAIHIQNNVFLRENFLPLNQVNSCSRVCVCVCVCACVRACEKSL